MNKLSLSFNEKALETKYISQHFQEKLEKMLSFIIALDFLVIIFQLYLLIISPFSGNANYILIFLAVFLIFLMILLKKLNKSRVLFTFLMINLYGQMILYIELTKLYLSQKNNDNSLILMIPFQMLHSMLIFIQTKWFICSFSYFCSLALLYFRVISLGPEQTPDFSVALMNFLSNWVLYSFLAYINEKNHRNSFKTIEESYQKINYFHLILKNVIPNPVFIVDFSNSRINFLNKSAISLINPADPSNNFSNNSNDYFPNFQKFLSSLLIIPQNLQKMKNSKESMPKSHLPEPFSPCDINEELLRFFLDESRKPISANNSKLLRIEELNDDYFYNCLTSTISQSLHTRKCYELKAVKVFWEEKISLLLLVSENTEAFQVSELANVENCKSQLLASISHDLRTPLNGIHGMIELALLQKDLEKTQEFLLLAKKSAIFLHFLIRNILDYSLFISKKARLDVQNVDLEEVLREMHELIGFQAESKGLDFKIVNSCDLSTVSLLSDRTRIKQILINLLSNALKFTEKGKIHLILEEVSTDNGKSLLKFSVKDTGEGIPAEQINKITSLFGKSKKKFSLDCFNSSPMIQRKINKEETGIGLGLTVSKKISRLLCPSKNTASFEIKSVFGEGSTFSFYLECLEKQSIEKQTLTASKGTLSYLNSNDYFVNESVFNKEKNINNFAEFEEAKHEKNLPKTPEKYLFMNPTEENQLIKRKKMLKVLVVDDDCMSLFVVEQYLKLLQMESHKACNGLEAYRIVQEIIEKKEIMFDLIVMDCNMPVLNGFKASRKIRKMLKENNLKQIPIIGMSANSTIPGKLPFQQSGMEFFLEKPIRKDDFKEIVEKISKPII